MYVKENSDTKKGTIPVISDSLYIYVRGSIMTPVAICSSLGDMPNISLAFFVFRCFG